MEDIKVSIICNAYNHEEYIRDTLDSFLMQKTNFKFEVLIHDDASTDKTADIIREYEAKYPDIIKPVYQTENQYSKGVRIADLYQKPRIKGDYVAFCEGDDYWIDPLKLQKQYDFLENNKGIDVCAHGAVSVHADTKKVLGYITPSKVSRIMPMEEVIMGDGGYVAANSAFYRKEAYVDTPEFKRNFRYQFTTKLRGSIRGGMYYIAEVMSAYRVLTKSSWTRKMASNPQKWFDFHSKKKKMFELLDEYTEYKYTSTIQEKIKLDQFQLLLQTHQYKEALKKENRCYLKKLSKKQRLSIFARARLPWLAKIIKR